LLQKVWQDAFVEEGSLTRTVSLLRKALQDGSDGQEYIATVPKRGYRFVAPVTLAEDVRRVTTAVAPALEKVPPPPRRRKRAVLAIVIAALLVAAVLVGRRVWLRPHPQSGRLMLAVIPFQNLTGDPNQEFFADGLTEEMITELAALNPQQLGVIARSSAMTYKSTSKSAAQIGRELGVNYILEGSVRTWGERVRITAQLIQVNDQTHVWADTFDRQPQDILALESDVANVVARQINVTLSPRSAEQISGVHAVNPAAYEAYRKGRFFWYKRTEDALHKGIDYFNQAVALDPTYAPAYVGLSDSYLMLAGRGLVPARDVLPQAKAAAEKALALNPQLGEAHASLGHVRLHDWDWSGLDEEFKRAIELNPANAFAHYYYSEYLMAMGRSEESINVVKKVQEIDPVSPILSTTLPSQYYFARMYEPAAENLRKALDLNPDFFLLHFRLAQVLIQQKKNQEAIAEMQRAVTLSNHSTEMLAGLAQAHAAAGMTAPMRDILAELDRRSRERYVQPYYIARVYASAGDRERTFAWLEKAYADRSIDLVELKIEPAFDYLRSDPRFTTLLHRVGWPN
jgi:TolB-like protein/lipoprotein NlpI